MIDVGGYGGDGQEFIIPPDYFYPVVPLKNDKRVTKGNKPRRPWVRTTGALLLGMVGVAIGLPFIVTAIFAPIGIIIMGAFCYPFYKMLDIHSKRLDAWYDRDRPLDEDTVKPWMI